MNRTRMADDLVFREATLKDAELLLSWRNDADTRENSLNSALVSSDQHLCWLEKTLADPNRKLLICEMTGNPVGTVRIDHLEPNLSELSWTVAPQFRGRGIGSSMVSKAAQTVEGRLIAKIKDAAKSSQQVAMRAGFKLTTTSDGITYWEKPATNHQM